MSECVMRMDIDEMPTACGPCKLICTAICKEWTKVDRKEIWHTKSPNCPILAILPEGHGRLVDAGRFERNMYFEWANGELSNSDWIDFRQWLKDEETVVPASDEERSKNESD